MPTMHSTIRSLNCAWRDTMLLLLNGGHCRGANRFPPELVSSIGRRSPVLVRSTYRFLTMSLPLRCNQQRAHLPLHGSLPPLNGLAFRVFLPFAEHRCYFRRRGHPTRLVQLAAQVSCQ